MAQSTKICQSKYASVVKKQTTLIQDDEVHAGQSNNRASWVNNTQHTQIAQLGSSRYVPTSRSPQGSVFPRVILAFRCKARGLYQADQRLIAGALWIHMLNTKLRSTSKPFRDETGH